MNNSNLTIEKFTSVAQNSRECNLFFNFSSDQCAEERTSIEETMRSEPQLASILNALERKTEKNNLKQGNKK
jgi:hypothetical protein